MLFNVGQCISGPSYENGLQVNVAAALPVSGSAWPLPQLIFNVSIITEAASSMDSI